MDQTYAEVAGSPPKKKRGRPRKTETVLLPGEVSALGVEQPVKVRKARVSQGDASPLRESNHQSMVGKPVHGVVDGSFDAGYLVTVRVGDSGTVYRGVVFGPGLSIPLTSENDVAPKVKNTSRDDVLPLTPPIASSPTPTPATAPAVSAADVPRSTPGFPVPPGAVPAYGSAPPAFRSSLDQDMLNAGGFMYPGVSQLHASHGFFPRGFGYPFHLSGSEYVAGGAQFGADAQGIPSRRAT